MAARAAEVFGRAKEFAAFRAVLDSAVDRLEVLVLQGDPGIGKTTILRGVVAHALDRGFTVLTSRPVAAESKMPFAGLDDLLSPVLDAVLTAIAPLQARALEVALLRREMDTSPLSQRMVAAASLSVMRALVKSNPLLVVVDDLEWLDASTSRVLSFCLRRLIDDPVIVLIAQRNEASSLGLDTVVAPECLHHLRVGPLGVPDLGRLLRDRLGIRLQRADLIQLGRISTGNPLFALELGRVFAADSGRRAPGESAPIPEHLRQLVVDRIAALPEPARGTLLITSLLVRPTVGLIQAASTLPDAVPEHLAMAEAAGVVELIEGRVRYTHPLLASLAYSDALPEDRRKLHRRLAELATTAEERALHLASSAIGPDEHIASALDAAARHARNRGAPEAAAAMAEQACRFTPEDQAARLRARALDAVELHFLAGNTAQARTLAERLVATASPGSETASALAQLGGIRLHEESIQAAVDVFERALAEPHDKVALRAECELGLGNALFLAAEFRHAGVHYQTSVEMMESVEGHPYLGTALSCLGFTSFLLGGGVSIDRMRRALALSEEGSGHPLISMHPKTVWGSILKSAGDLDTARDLLGQMRNRASLLGEVESLPVILYHLSELETWSGRWEQAAVYAQGAYEAADQSGHEPGRAVAMYAQALVEAHLGHVESAKGLAQEGLAVATRSSAAVRVLQNLAVLGFIEFSRGDMASAWRYLDPAIRATLAAGVAEPGVLRFLPEGIEILIRLGDLHRAAELLEPFEHASGTLDRAWGMATAERCRGLFVAARGDLAQALEHLNAAIGHHQRVNQPFELARTLLVLGELQRRLKRRGQARDTLISALEIFRGMHAALWVERARGELQSVGGRAPALHELTPTEQQIADQVAAGRTNREVAETLFISVRTVEDNLSKVYRKLGIRSRTQLVHALSVSNPSTTRTTTSKDVDSTDYAAPPGT